MIFVNYADELFCISYSSACRRVLNTIKNMITKCKDNRVRPASVESVTKRLQERIADIIAAEEASSFKSPDKVNI